MIAAVALLLVVIAAGLVGTLIVGTIIHWINEIRKEWRRNKMKYCIKCGTEILHIKTKCDRCNGWKDMDISFAGRGENIGEFFIHNWYLHTKLSGVGDSFVDTNPKPCEKTYSEERNWHWHRYIGLYDNWFFSEGEYEFCFMSKYKNPLPGEIT